ncbi:glycosyltransferase [Clostridium sp. ZS2-4]|uniref:glycosyltransferase n=1 Tax=Clostridium sp. ZS2-4 TaxID=2987703 RepID=UPI00227A6410|nr:glycosyltransferase [Clostridium sp. ZS2-4]MCY6353857.1 glycosyltransferase [Clostridium sp. ZS2-4]
MKKVLFISYYFPPLGWSGVQRSLKFVKYLRCFDWEPIVVTVKNSPFCIKDNTLLEEIPKNLKIIRIESSTSKQYTDKIVNEIKKSIAPILNVLPNDYCKFYEDYIYQGFNNTRTMLALPDDEVLWTCSVLRQIESAVNLNDIDLIYTTSGPYSAHFIGHTLKKKHAIPWVTDFRDEWTNYPYYTLDKNNIFFKIQREMETKILSFCDKVITISPISKLNYIRNFNIDDSKISIITNGYDESDFNDIPRSNKNNKFTIIHNGSLYLERDPNSILKAINNLIDKGILDKEKIEIKFIGTCNPDIYKSIFENNQYNTIKYIQYLPHAQSLIEASKADLLLLIVGKNPKLKSAYTGKIFEYLRLKTPILSLSPENSVVEDLLNITSCGKNFEFNDITSIENYIRELYINWTQDNLNIHINEEELKKFDRKFLTYKLSKVFDNIVSDQ